MVSTDATWLQPHVDLYEKALADLQANPPQPPIEKYLTERLPALWTMLSDVQGYAGPDFTIQMLKDGDPVKFWTGAKVIDAPFETADFMTGDYTRLAKKVMGLAREIRARSPVIVDLGSGMSTLTVALRALNCPFRTVNLECMVDALKIGETVVAALGVKDTHFLPVDIGGVLTNLGQPADRFHKALVEYVGDSPIILASRFAMFPFYSPEEYGRIFSFFLGTMKARAGVHLEMSGFKTVDYDRICKAAGKTLEVSHKSQLAPGDPLAYIAGLKEIKVHEKQGMWPQPLTTRYSSLLSWIAR